MPLWESSDEVIERLEVDDVSSTRGVSLPDLERYRYAAGMAADRVVLDVASGTGYGSYLLATLGRASRVISVDCSPTALAASQRWDAPPVISRVCADCTSLPLADDAVDLVVSFETIEHVTEPRAFLRELRRVLKPGGTALISTPLNESESRLRPANRHHVREFSRSEFMALCREFFSQVEHRYQEIQYADDLFPPRVSSLPGVAPLRRLARNLLSPMLRRSIRRFLGSGGLLPVASAFPSALGEGRAASVQLALCR
jgi:ubiquinone/menaquinone biosynthesis C-methylase UbiE